MSKRSQILTFAGVVVVVGMIAMLTLPNYRARKPAFYAPTADLRYLSEPSPAPPGKYRVKSEAGAMVGGGSAGADQQFDRKMVRTAALEIVVDDVPKLAAQLESLASKFGGYVEKTEVSQSKGIPQRAQVVLRVPAARLDEVRAEIKRSAQLVETDKTDAVDVTRQFVDNEARLRNYQAEERQYLEIMRRAVKVEDTVKVAERLSDVRGRIEQLQAELKYLSQQVEMASIVVALRMESVAQSSQWQPWYQTKLAFADMVEGLITFADSIIYILLMLPVVLLWIVTIVAATLAVFKLFLWAKRRFPHLSKPLGGRSQS